MTRQKHLKALVRERMRKTGERYATARRHIIGDRAAAAAPGSPHLPGSVPLPTALRVLLTHVGVTGPGGASLSEALTLVLAGGIGAGVFAFQYPQFSSFYVAGRHLWYDDLASLSTACARLGLTPVVKEFGGAGPAEKGLIALLERGPVIDWVDMGTLPHRGMPPSWSGGGYHLVTIYQAMPGGDALIGDLADDPIALPMKALTTARGRIKKDKFRLLAVDAPRKSPDLTPALAAALAACGEGLRKGRIRNFTVAAFATWAEQLHGAKGKESWEKMFPPGPRLWRGLTSIHEFVEHYGTGGGLIRPLFAEGLREAATLVRKPALDKLANAYAALGERWSALADAALPEGIPAFDEARRLFGRKTELVLEGSGGADGARQTWEAIEALGARAAREFPLKPADAESLRRDLQTRVRALATEEARLAEQL